MKSQHLTTNLRLLCSYVGSVAECCRKIGINRQQFSKYLNGNTQPSMQSLRKICDYFGVDTEEINLPPETFKPLISNQQRTNSPLNILNGAPENKRYTQQLTNMVTHSNEDIERYLGDYYYYYMSPSFEGSITKGFARLSLVDGICYSHFYERAEPKQAMLKGYEIGKFIGIVFLLGERLQIVDYSVNCQRAVSQTILYGATKGNISLLSGLTMGIQGRNARIPFTARVVFERLSSQLTLRQKLKGVKLLDIEGNQVSNAIMSRLTSTSNITNPHIFTAPENF